MRKMRPREVPSLASSHTADKQWHTDVEAACALTHGILPILEHGSYKRLHVEYRVY